MLNKSFQTARNPSTIDIGGYGRLETVAWETGSSYVGSERFDSIRESRPSRVMIVRRADCWNIGYADVYPHAFLCSNDLYSLLVEESSTDATHLGTDFVAFK